MVKKPKLENNIVVELKDINLHNCHFENKITEEFKRRPGLSYGIGFKQAGKFGLTRM